MSITFDKIAKHENGARFYSGDLHVHTFGGSADVKDETMTVKNVIDSALRQKITLLSITDHNTDANIVSALEYGAQFAEKLLIIPGVEITTANGHLLAYFAPEHVGRVRDLLAFLRIQGALGSRESHTAMSLASVVAEVERLGGIAVAAHIDRQKTGFEVAVDGYPNAKKDIIAASGLFGLEFDEPANLKWYSAEDDPSPAGNERKKLLAMREEVTATAARTRLAPVQNSDAHSLAAFNDQHAKRFLTRYKLNELTFEAFKVAMSDPEARVRAVATIPKRFPRVTGMYISGGFLDEGYFHFSDNLNCFIGGRGAGKSTAIQSLTYGLGVRDDLERHDNCPDTVVVYCEDVDGIKYRYERNRGDDPIVQALENKEITEVPTDSFRLEFYAQGELSEVAKDPLANPRLFQQFLDRHTVLDDLFTREGELLNELQQNSSQLIPLEASTSQLPVKKKELSEIETKLRIAEAGRLKDLVAFQGGVAAEKALANDLREVQRLYTNGLSLSKWKRSPESIGEVAGALTGDVDSADLIDSAKKVVSEANEFVAAAERRTNEGLRDLGTRLAEVLAKIDSHHRLLDQRGAEKVAEFRKQGLTGDLAGLTQLLKRRTALAAEVARIASHAIELQQIQERRRTLLEELDRTRSEISRRRKDQLTVINTHLRQTIDDYLIHIYYDKTGVTDEFAHLVLRVMQGSYFQEEAARNLCAAVSPRELAEVVRNRDETRLETLVGRNFAGQLLERFSILLHFHQLEAVAKPEKPILKVVTRGSVAKVIPANQLSDGQKHTILLTIALLAESNLPLIIDQPEDDLDNAFIFSSVVKTLRTIKERRQVILVTHNANIAVLGDSELIFPLRRVEHRGGVFERGSIDRAATSLAVQSILEGGRIAFQKRKTIYGY